MAKILSTLAILFTLSFLGAITVYAHPGNTASDGCHYCRTNCSSWGVPWNARHCHTGYTTPTYIAPVITYTTDTKTELIPFEKSNENDATLEAGKTKIKQVGVNGERTILYSVKKSDGIEVSRTVSNNKITKAPITEITSVGTKKIEVKQAAPSTSNKTEDEKAIVAGATDFFQGLFAYLLIAGGIAWYFIKKDKK